MKACGRCRAVLPEGSFHRRGDGGTRSECRACNTAKMRAYRAANRDKCRAYQRARYANNPEPAKALANEYSASNRSKINARARLRNTGWTADQFEMAWTKQGGRCAICRSPLRRGRGKGAAAADHDHATGVQRGLLCTECNCGLGCFQDDPKRIIEAARYVRRMAQRAQGALALLNP